MEKQYVYIARMINHKNEFIDGYYKLGKTKHYTIRETQLTATHLPIDVIMVRVFETPNMSKTETLFQTCFEDYNVTKKYENRKDKKTEWVWIDDEEILYDRINKIVNALDNVNEIDLINDIKIDTETTKQEKQELIQTFRKSISRLSLSYNNVDYTQETSTETFLTALKIIAEQTSWNKIMENEIRVTKTIDELKDRNPSANPSQLKPFEDHFVFTGNNNETKLKLINKLIKKLNIKNLHPSLTR